MKQATVKTYVVWDKVGSRKLPNANAAVHSTENCGKIM
jgi:hypothetical protein